MANTNYGTYLKKAATVLGEIVNIDPPELINEAVESTNHSSGGYREFISGGLRELTEFTCTVNFIGVTVSGIMTDVVAGTKASYSIEFTDDATTKWTFDAIPTSFKPSAMDAQSPDVLQAEITLRPSGIIVIA